MPSALTFVPTVPMSACFTYESSTLKCSENPGNVRSHTATAYYYHHHQYEYHHTPMDGMLVSYNWFFSLCFKSDFLSFYLGRGGGRGGGRGSKKEVNSYLNVTQTTSLY